MAHPVLLLVIAAGLATSHAASSVDLNAESKDPISLAKSSNLIIIADRDGPADGPDPHGKDPHDERHDPGLPAREHKDDYKPKEDWKAPQDPYGGDIPNGQKPY